MHHARPVRLPRIPPRRGFSPLVTGLVSSVATVLVLAGAAHAEEVVLHSGKVRRGKIVDQDKQFVIVETSLGRLRIERTQIARILEDGTLARESAAHEAGSGTSGEPTTQPPTQRPPDPPAQQPDASGGETPIPEPVAAPMPTPLPESARPSVGEPTGDDAAPTGLGAAPRRVAEERAQALDAAERLRRRRDRRIVRRTAPGDATTSTAMSRAVEPAETATTATIGGRDLVRVPRGTNVIVFEPPQQFEKASGAIEIGRRSFAAMEIAGVATARLRIPVGDEGTRLVLNLAKVKRHIEVTQPDKRVSMLEGINAGDWLRVVNEAGEVTSGRLESIVNGHVRLDGFDDELKAESSFVPVRSICQIDGLVHDTAAQLALLDLSEGEPLSVTFWPDGREILGRYVKTEPHELALDVDGDGEPDEATPRLAPLAEVRRVPMRHRDLAAQLRPGFVVRVDFAEDLPDALVERTTLGRVLSLTAHAVSIETPSGAIVVPFAGLEKLEVISEHAERAIDRWSAKVPMADAVGGLKILPGSPAAEGRALDASSGVSAVTDGVVVTHVFVTAPFDGEVFGTRVGAPASRAGSDLDIRFDTSVTPHDAGTGIAEPRELLSDTVEGLRIALLVDPAGFVTAIEISAAE